jgi:hypothetical protein
VLSAVPRVPPTTHEPRTRLVIRRCKVQDEEMRCDRCGAIIVPFTWWQINVNDKPVCEACVARGTGHMFSPPPAAA